MATERKPGDELAGRLKTVTPERPIALQRDHTSWARALTALARKPALQRGVHLLLYALLGVVICVAALVAAVTLPALFGYHTFIVYGDSMAPALRAGDVAITKPIASEDVRVGDIIAARSNPRASPVLHRVTAIEEEDGQLQFIIKGDSNDTADPRPVLLLGSGDRVVQRIPLVGYLLHFARTWPGRLLFVFLPVLLLGGIVIWEIWRPRRRAEVPSPLSAPAGPAPGPAPAAVPPPALEVIAPDRRRTPGAARGTGKPQAARNAAGKRRATVTRDLKRKSRDEDETAA